MRDLPFLALLIETVGIYSYRVSLGGGYIVQTSDSQCLDGQCPGLGVHALQ